jgi:ubiquinone/menaquinone biosynthesis C-methylase UbiE
MSQSFLRPSRKARVTAQYESAQAADEYARAHDGSAPAGRFFRSRLRLVQDVLASCPGGDLLDAGCGPGVMVLTLLKSRPHDFRITALDQSPAMVKYCADSVREVGEVRAMVGELEAMPLGDASFDVTLVMGALEYTSVQAAVQEISRVTRQGGLVIVTMLNPLSLYRLTEWFLYWPLLRMAGAIQRFFGIPAERRRGVRRSGAHALPAGKLQRLLRHVGLQPVDVIYFDVTPLIPPFDRLPRMKLKAQQTAHARTVTRGWRRWMGTAYLVVARRS